VRPHPNTVSVPFFATPLVNKYWHSFRGPKHWAEERMERSMLAELQSKLAYEDFNEWCEENGHKLTLTQTTFSERLKLLGYEKVRKNKAVFWRDVQLVK